MLAYSLYTMLAVGLALLLSAVFRRLRRDDQRVAPPGDDAAFNRRISEIETDYGLKPDTRPGTAPQKPADPAFDRRMRAIGKEYGGKEYGGKEYGGRGRGADRRGKPE